MGGTESKALSVNANEQVVINETDVSTLNEQINNTIAKSVMSSASNCSGNVEQSQKIQITGCGDVNITGTTMKQEADINFECINVANIESQLAQNMLASLASEISSNMDAKAENKMVAEAEAKSKGDAFSLPQDVSSMAVSANTFKTMAVNKTNQHIENVIGSNIEVGFDVESVSDCTTSLKQKQELAIKDCQAGKNVNIKDFTMEQGTKSLSNCLNQMGVAQKIVSETAADLGVVVETETKAKSVSDMAAKSVASSIVEMCGGSFSNPSASFATSGIACIIVYGLISAISAASGGFGGSESDSSGTSKGV